MGFRIAILVLLLAGAGGLLIFRPGQREEADNAPAASFEYLFDSTGTLAEADEMGHSTSPYWWLDSGALLTFASGTGKTIQWELPQGNPWRVLYKRTSPRDTSDGARPQNLFRLITKSEWLDARQEASFKIERYERSDSPNRNESNAVLLLSRYQDADNLYYAGLRVDGFAVIKKKYRGKYYTLDEARVFSGRYDRDTNPFLLPQGAWFGIRSETRNLENGKVEISLFYRMEGDWRRVLQVVDTGEQTPSITGKGHVGIRTDFMDVAFDDFRIAEGASEAQSRSAAP